MNYKVAYEKYMQYILNKYVPHIGNHCHLQSPSYRNV